MPALNPAQLEAVTNGDGYALILAGAGTGKTRVIIERMVWLVEERGVNPRALLALTFTNRAAGEMRERFARRLALESVGAWVGTFHAFGLFALRRYMDKLGRPRNFTVFDDADQLSLMKRLIRETGAGVSPRNALSWISRLKQDLAGPPEEIETPEERVYAELWGRYHGALGRASAVDFDDLLVLLVRLLDGHEEVRDALQRRFHYVSVDEYQDTNRAQYEIAKRLAARHGNLFVVGDEDQSIYSWRGADINNILNFQEDFPDAKTFRLEQNYRSTGAILRAANAVVANNRHRLGKRLWTAGDAGEPPRVYLACDGEDEARFVVDEIAGRGLAPERTAVLFRTNGQARLMEEALRRKGMPYVVVGGTQFYARKEVRDLLGYLRLLTNPADDEALRRILNVPRRGIGAATMAQLDEYTATRGAPLFEVLRDVEHDQTIPARARAAVGELVHLIDELAHAAGDTPVAGLVNAVLDRTGYRQYVERSDERDFRARLEVVDEFASACAEFDARSGAGELAAFLQDLALVSDVDAWDASTPAVTLMTCHSAKGLEFDHVFLIGLEEGLLPHASALGGDRELEEERRLCYVAMTRARKSLILCHAEARTLYGERKPCEASRFLREMPADGLEAAGMDAQPVRGARVGRPGAPRAEAGGITRGTRVRHAAFGPGTVIKTEGSGSNLRVRIRFLTGRVRLFKANAAPLEILEEGDEG
ncbi:MAG: UvrD-helicase domain-containing protein [Candidatus Hydrogenedentes bacterium]|nr:UvrD-helicase domain-containing protein [Candidatus Hydrogenedentota bacterium]